MLRSKEPAIRILSQEDWHFHLFSSNFPSYLQPRWSLGTTNPIPFPPSVPCPFGTFFDSNRVHVPYLPTLNQAVKQVLVAAPPHQSAAHPPARRREADALTPTRTYRRLVAPFAHLREFGQHFGRRHNFVTFSHRLQSSSALGPSPIRTLRRRSTPIWPPSRRNKPNWLNPALIAASHGPDHPPALTQSRYALLNVGPHGAERKPPSVAPLIVAIFCRQPWSSFNLVGAIWVVFAQILSSRAVVNDLRPRQRLPLFQQWLQTAVHLPD
ncbi:hypothetical protein L484_008809 [Morus notabilis]|uniref:Uncharacterized protein n=1 Tax=Morus notabilis TaxID=981085 RepID=W9QZH8_9ROSA|nr:hypothetical protein L484_008809 [Morus notabilis]